VVVMDKDVRPTSRLLSNVEPGGWVLWPLAQANSLRAMGKYQCKGILDSESASPAVREADEAFWEEAEVKTDDELASAKEDEGIVTFEEAQSAVEKAFGTRQNIVENYKRLIKMAKEQNASAVAMGISEVTCTVDYKGEPIELLHFKLTLPLAEKDIPKNSYAIFHKNLNV